ncbi:hypothetical protein D910_04472 [Dendroctonus ponderosae]|uniref:Uncharacterized protein n=1 Tax=Dendroctonus ponderosae TaxID=77166 RepID=U4U8X4_DENPD|nr:hypothetical protein D910_04472 [Dendroctonus ponderosae]
MIFLLEHLEGGWIGDPGRQQIKVPDSIQRLQVGTVCASQFETYGFNPLWDSPKQIPFRVPHVYCISKRAKHGYENNSKATSESLQQQVHGQMVLGLHPFSSGKAHAYCQGSACVGARKTDSGSCFSWDEEPKTVSDISTSPLEHLLIKSDNDEDGDESFQVLVKSMAKQKKRMIPVNEIALAIVSCSCDVNCNPSFNKAAQVFAVPDDKTQLGNVLVGETQTQPAFSKSLAVETEKAIPESLPPDHWVRKVDAQPKPLKRLNGKEIESPLCKKPKLDNNTSKPTKWISLDQSINLPKRQENTSEASRIMANSTLQSQKRKASDDAEKCLKINPFTNMSTPASKKSKTGSANPFALFKPISKPTRPETARKSSNPFASIMSTNRPTPTVKMEEIEIENSPPPESRLESTRNISVHSAISIKQLSVNFRWISKSLPSVHSVKANTDDDPELLEISKALRDCIQVTTFSVHERPTPPINKTQNSVGERNFKKFKKVKPLRPQVTVISYHQLERVGPGDISKISLNENFSDDEPEPIRSRKFPNVKPVGKRFIL